jgi:Fur family transcriptional regulator, ferric uptake regulator
MDSLAQTATEIEADIVRRCQDRGLRITGQRRVIASIVAKAQDHPDIEELHRRAQALDSAISLSTVYRTMRLFQDLGITLSHDFKDHRARFELAETEHHDHFIDVRTGRVIEFRSPEIERLQAEIAARYGYRIIDHRLEIYVAPLGPAPTKP